MTIEVGADTKPAKAKTTRLRKEEEKPIETPIDLEFGRARAQMAVFRQAQERNPVKIKVEVDRRKFDREFTAMSHTIAEFNRTNIAVVNFAALGASAIGPAALGLANLADALQRVAQAGLAVPGAIAGVASSVGTLAFGLSGISQAWKDSQTAAQSSGRTQADAAKQAAAAQNQLRNAVHDEADARKDLNRAYKEAQNQLRDLRIAQRGGVIDESRAILNAQQARERFRKGDFTDIRDILLDIQEADQTVLETRAQNADRQDKLNDATQKGIANSDAVTSANERLIRTQQQLTEATQNVADAMGKTSAAQDKFSQSLANLSPAAQNLVNTFIRLKPEFLDFRNSIQEPLLEGKAKEFEDFFHNIVPIITPGMQSIARAWNKGMTEVTKSLGSDQNKGLIERILGNTAEAQTRLNAAIDPLINAVGILTAAGSDALPRMADALVTVSEKFEAFIREADQSGELKRWIDEGLDAIGDLSSAIFNVGQIFTDITKAAGGGGTFLEWLHTATGDLHTFLSSAEGQNTIRQFFADAREEIAKWKPLVQDLPGVINGIIQGLQGFSDLILGPLTDISDLLSKYPRIVETAFTAFVVWTTAKGVVGGINAITNAVNLLAVALGGEAVAGAGVAGIAAPSKGLAWAVRFGPFAGLLALLGYTIAYGDTPGAVPDRGNQQVPLAAQPGLFAPQDQPPGGPPTAAQPGLFPATPLGPAGTQPGQTPFDVAPRRDHAPVNQYPTTRAGDLHPGDPVPPGYYWTDGQLYQDGKKVDPNTLISSAAFAPAPQRPGPPRRKVGDLKSGDPLPPPYYWTPEGVRDGFGRLMERDFLLPAIPGSLYGGPTPNRRGPGPTGGYVVELHGGEWILPQLAREQIGDKRLARWTRGVMPGFQTGGPHDPYGPPQPIAPNPYGTQGGGPDILGQIVAGAQQPISNAINVGTSLAQASASAAGGTAHGTLGGALPGPAPGVDIGAAPAAPDFATSFGQNLLGSFGIPGLGGSGGGTGNTGITPGLWGLGQVFNPNLSPEQQGAMLAQWGGQTGEWLGNFTAKYTSAFVGTLLGTTSGPSGPGGILGGLGLSGLVSSPYTQAAQATAQHFTSLIPRQQDTSQITPEMWQIIQSNPALLQQLMPGTYTPSLAGTGAPGMGASLWDAVAKYESSGNWSDADSGGNGHFGGLQFSPETWHAYGGTGMPNEASREMQIAIANRVAFTGYNGKPPQGLGAWEVITKGMVPGVSVNTPSSAFNSAAATGGAPQLSPGNFDIIDAIASQRFGLHVTSGFRDPNGPQVAGVPASRSYHGSGRAHDYGGPKENMTAFANYMAQNFGSQLKEEIYDAPGFSSTIKDGQIVGPFGSFYTHDQAGDHSDHVHIAYGAGGPVGYAYGGPIAAALPVIPPPPPRPPDARMITPPKPPAPSVPRTPSAAPSIPTPSPVGPQAPPTTPAAPSTPAGPAPQPVSPALPTLRPSYAAPIAKAPEQASPTHTLPWVDKAIDSGAQALGQAVSTAMGIGGGFVPGLGAAGPYAAGLVMQGGKIVKGIANVISSAMVGSVPGSYGTTNAPYGDTLQPAQRELATGTSRVASYGPFFGHDTRSVMRDIQVHEGIEHQVAFANYSARRL